MGELLQVGLNLDNLLSDEFINYQADSIPTLKYVKYNNIDKITKIGFFDKFKIIPISGLSEFEENLIKAGQNLGAFILGGYARYIIDRSKLAEDIDIYDFRGCLKDFIDDIFTVVRSVGFGRGISNFFIKESPHPLQIISSFAVKTVVNKLKEFDLSIAQAAIISPTEAIVSLDFLETLKTNNIKVINRTKNYDSRLIKYMMRGYDIDIVDCLKLMNDKDKLSPAEQFKLAGYVKSKDYDKDGVFGELIMEGYFGLKKEHE